MIKCKGDFKMIIIMKNGIHHIEGDSLEAKELERK